ncbi:MAG: hypothetical protein LBH71_02615 [Oscillospiraceae bacterium]|nr:hypothetical protein [Oscillospiraceae bacterium]
MNKILRRYALSTASFICMSILIVGVITARNNTRKLSFGEEYDVVQIYASANDRIDIESGSSNIEVPIDAFKKARETIGKAVCFFVPSVNNSEWLKESILNIF